MIRRGPLTWVRSSLWSVPEPPHRDHRWTCVGIIGAGRIGQAMTGVALRAGREVVIANSRGPESLTSLVATLGDGVTAGAVDDAAAAGTAPAS